MDFIRLQKKGWLMLAMLGACLPPLISQKIQPGDSVPWKPAVEYPEPVFRFATIGDLTGGYRWGVFPDIAQKLDWLRPDFVMSVGDLIEGYTEDEAQIERWWDQFTGWLDGFPAPFFFVPGNHDLSNALMTRIWERRLGKTYYSFEHRGVIFLVLNSEDGAPSRISARQVRFVEQLLAATSPEAQILIFLHKPLWYGDESGFSAIEQLLDGRPYTVFAGHTHRYAYEERHGRPYYLLATCGGGSALRGAAFGEWDHVSWVSVYPDTSVVTNISAEGIIPGEWLSPKRKKRVEDFLRAREGISHIPLFPKETDEQVHSVLSFPNPGNQALRVNAHLKQHDRLRAMPGQIVATVGPKDTLQVPVTIQRLPGEDWPNVDEPLRWTVEQQEWQVGEPLTLPMEYEMPLLPVYTCPIGEHPPQLDGKLGEWSMPEFRSPRHVGYYTQTWTGPDDLQMAAQVMQMGDTLYLALGVIDDAYHYDIYRNSWEQDGAELQIQFSGQAPVRLGFEVRQDHTIVVDRERFLPQGYRIKGNRSEKGFEVELAIPIPSGSIPEFVLNWIVYDHDRGEDPWKGTQAWYNYPYHLHQTYRFNK